MRRLAVFWSYRSPRVTLNIEEKYEHALNLRKLAYENYKVLQACKKKNERTKRYGRRS